MPLPPRDHRPVTCWATGGAALDTGGVCCCTGFCCPRTYGVILEELAAGAFPFVGAVGGGGTVDLDGLGVTGSAPGSSAGVASGVSWDGSGVICDLVRSIEAKLDSRSVDTSASSSWMGASGNLTRRKFS